MPLRTLRKITIPLYLEHEDWNRGRAAITPPFAAVLVLFVTGSKVHLAAFTSIAGFPALILFPLLSLPITIYIFLTSKRSRLPAYNFVLSTQGLVLASFVLSIFWICSVCDVMVEVLALMGTLLALPNQVLGMTLLALGNSSGDFWADIAVSRLGMPESAIAACFAGPLFNLCVGVGIAMLIATYESSMPISLVSTTLICFVLLLIVNIYTIIYFVVRRKLTKCHAKLLICVFLGFTVALFL